MNYHHIAYFFAIAVGVVSSGAIGSLWAWATDEVPDLSDFEEPDLLTPLRGVAIVLSAPTTLLVHSLWNAFSKPFWAFLLLLAGLGWSFVQGVFIMSQIFGVT